MMNERIKKLRKELKLTQQEFADRIGIKRNTLANYEIGRNEPIDAVISLICRTFHVNEDWLRNGEGEPYAHTTRNDELFAWAEKLAAETGDTFPKRLAVALSRLNEKGWETLEGIAKDLLESKEVTLPVHDEAPLPEERPEWMTEEEWQWFQRRRTAEAGENTVDG